MQDLNVSTADHTAKRAAWFKIIEDYQSSGQSQVGYCRQHNIKMEHFAYYLGRWRKANIGKDEQVSFMQVQVTDQIPTDKWILNIAKSISLEVPHNTPMQQLAELISNLRAVTC